MMAPLLDPDTRERREREAEPKILNRKKRKERKENKKT